MEIWEIYKIPMDMYKLSWKCIINLGYYYFPLESQIPFESKFFSMKL